MTMFVDRRKDNYDELLVLAQDSRVSRARTNRWTTGLIVTAMAGSAAYVATMDQQVDDLRETATEAAKDRDTIQSKYTMLKAEILALTRYQDLYADIAPTQNLSNSIGKLAERLGQEPGLDGKPYAIKTMAYPTIYNLLVDPKEEVPELNYLPDTWVDFPIYQVLEDHQASIKRDPGAPDP